MSSDAKTTQIALMQAQLNDLEYLIEMREDELRMLRNSTDSLTAFRSQLETSMLEREEMERKISEFQQKYHAILNREEAMENELVQYIGQDRSVEDWERKNQSLRAELEIVLDELAEARKEIEELTVFRSLVTELQSKMEMMSLKYQRSE